MDDEKLEYTIDVSNMNLSPPQFYSTTLSASTPTYSVTGASGSFLTTGGYNGTSWTTTAPNPNLQVKGDAEFEGDVKFKGRSLEKLLEKIESRLAILEDPSPKKLEKYAALKKAYEHYKTLERLIGED